jgi:hypothetical protein
VVVAVVVVVVVVVVGACCCCTISREYSHTQHHNIINQTTSFGLLTLQRGGI